MLLNADENTETETGKQAIEPVIYLQANENNNSIYESGEDEIELIKKPSRHGKTANFSPVEYGYLDKIFTARNEAGLSVDWNHFLRQCVDYAVNARGEKNLSFAVPDIPAEYLKNAFFKPVK